MKCYCKILHISYKDHVTNEEVCAKIQSAIGPHEDLLMILKRHKLQWYGHVSHPSSLAKTILQGTVEGGRRQGTQKKRWEDNIWEWTSLEFRKFQWAVENREKGENWLQNHLWCPNALTVKGLIMMLVFVVAFIRLLSSCKFYSSMQHDIQMSGKAELWSFPFNHFERDTVQQYNLRGNVWYPVTRRPLSEL